jgi:hypothetical protein
VLCSSRQAIFLISAIKRQMIAVDDKGNLRFPSGFQGKSMLAMGLFFALAFARPASPQDGLEVSFSSDQGSITLHAADVPLDQVLDAVGEAAGIELIRQEKHTTPVTVDLVDVPVKTALERLLGRSNYTMQEDSTTGLPVKVWLMSTIDREVIVRQLDAERRREEQIARQLEAQRRATETEQAPKGAPPQKAKDSSHNDDDEVAD